MPKKMTANQQRKKQAKQEERQKKMFAKMKREGRLIVESDRPYGHLPIRQIVERSAELFVNKPMVQPTGHVDHRLGGFFGK